MNLSLLTSELTNSTQPPWESTPQGMIVKSSNQKVIGYCSSEFDARLIATLRNDIDELIERLDESFDQIDELTERLDESFDQAEYDTMVSDYDDQLKALEKRLEQHESK